MQIKKKISVFCVLMSALFFSLSIKGADVRINTNDLADLLSQESEHDEMPIPRHLSPGRMYYDALLEQKRERHWTLKCVMHSSVATKGFDRYSQRKQLAGAYFGGAATLADVYLLANLSANNQISTDTKQPSNPDRPENNSDALGTYASDQYLALLADATLTPDMEAREFGIDICASYRCMLGEQKRVACTVGCIVPIKSQVHIFGLDVIGGSLYSPSFPTGTGTAIVNTSLTQFYQYYSTVLDFFYRGILAPKGLAYEPRQRAMGVGDISFFGILDFAQYFKRFASLQMGATLVLPVGAVGNQHVLFPVSLGNGSVQFDFFVNMIFLTKARMFNPALHVIGNIAPTYSTTQRIPVLITNQTRQQMAPQITSTTTQVNVDLYNALNPPPPYDTYWVNPFSAYDSTTPAFANNVFPVKLSRANRVTFGFGNYWYNLFGTGLELAIFYDIIHKNGDSFCLDKKAQCNPNINSITDAELDLDKMYELSDERTHMLSWTLSYQFENLVNINMGSQNVIAGKNVAREQEFFVSLIVVF